MSESNADRSALESLFAGSADTGSLLGNGLVTDSGSDTGSGTGPNDLSAGAADARTAAQRSSSLPAEAPQQRRVIIIGSGPAGWTAALYLARAGFKPLVVAGALNPGGQLVNTSTVENYPGFPDGIQGPDLMTAMRRQAEKFGAEVTPHDVTRVTFPETARTDSVSRIDAPDSAASDPRPSDPRPSDPRLKTIVLDSGAVYQAPAVIVTTGSSYRHLDVPGEKRYGGHGVSYCATCDGFFFKGKKIAVVGGGDSAFQDALFLTRFADVTLIHRREGFRASSILVERAKNNPKIHFRLDSTVAEITGDGKKVTGVTLSDTRDGSTSDLPLDGVFVAIGMDPNTAFLDGQLALDDHGYIRTEAGSTRTNVPGVFAAGDVADPVYQQAVSAAGMGCRAALDAQAYLDR